ncbi:hypothetical protein BGX24_002399, partial [Mortierella sp. AD032]
QSVQTDNSGNRDVIGSAEKLKGLSRLRVVAWGGNRSTPVTLQDVEWMVEHWPGLEEVVVRESLVDNEA